MFEDTIIMQITIYVEEDKYIIDLQPEVSHHLVTSYGSCSCLSPQDDISILKAHLFQLTGVAPSKQKLEHEVNFSSSGLTSMTISGEGAAGRLCNPH